MLFTSYAFVLLFLPAVAVLYWYSLRLCNLRAALGLLTLSSLFFYGWWNPLYLWLIGFSIGVNYLVSRLLAGDLHHINRRLLLVMAVATNLSLLGYFKYAGFIVENVGVFVGSGFSVGKIILPLAISFFTFQQIAYIVDVYRDRSISYRLSDYVLFVTFFPQLIAGPIVRHDKLIPQFSLPYGGEKRSPWIARGLALFIMGMFKKNVLSDSLDEFSTLYFDKVVAGAAPTFVESWESALAFSLQIYFDFSGYSDMAIGLALMFGFILPVNFNIPYRAANIQEFWRRWHISLSTFLRDYLYIPLGGNRKGLPLQVCALAVTMFLGGLWHGASWSFVAWGLLHGLALGIHVLWRKLGLQLPKPVGWLLLFIFLVFTWVIFRAEDMSTGADIMLSMISWSADSASQIGEVHWSKLVVAMLFATLGPSSTVVALDILNARKRYAVFLGLLFTYLVVKGAYEAKEFIYFQF
jgi:alginate O-acetyltransferase complex protein AlgI